MCFFHVNMKTVGLLFIAGVFLAAPARRPDIDHIGNYNFKIEIEGVAAGQFTACDGLSVEQEVVEYRNGDDPVIRKRPGRVKYGDIRLKKGIVNTERFLAWRQAAVNGEHDGKHVSVILEDDTSREIARWNAFECWPAKWQTPSLKATGGDTLIEALTLSVQKITYD